MTQSRLPLPVFIINDEALEQLVEYLSGKDLLGIDTESNSMYVYRSQVCLIQVSTRQQDYIIDPLAIKNMQPFGKLLADASIEKIFHGAEYDIICLKRDFGFQFTQLFDTMQAARLLRLDVQSLSDLIFAYFQIEMDKTQRLANWGQRPLTVDMVHYARLDTRYLPMLRDVMYKELKKYDLLDEAYEIFADSIHVDLPVRDFDPDGFWKIGRPHRLKRRALAALKEIYLLREHIAQEEDKPPHNIMSNRTMVALAQQRPTNHRELNQIRGVPDDYRYAYADDILDAIESAATKAPGKPPPRKKQNRATIARYNALYAWRKELAEERGLDSSIVLPKQTLRLIAKASPHSIEELAHVEGIGAWRLQNYGETLLKILKRFR